MTEESMAGTTVLYAPPENLFDLLTDPAVRDRDHRDEVIQVSAAAAGERPVDTVFKDDDRPGPGGEAVSASRLAGTPTHRPVLSRKSLAVAKP